MTESGNHRSGVQIDVLPGTYAICRLPVDAPVPPLPPADGLRSITVTDREVSIVCRESDVPAGAEVDGGWSALYLAGSMPFDLAGVLVSVLAPISAAGLGVFALSTFDSDVVLVRAAALDQARNLLQNAGHEVRSARS